MLYLQNWNWELNINEETYTNVPTQRKLREKELRLVERIWKQERRCPYNVQM